ncbi:MAG TPA: NAD-dependent epimerase/dehydratase family protein [Terrimicrobiaceae bacterium]|nr:NAD-dependent epimerase/dehydratase family protein [Terrimicrobiaceae bacterium]
MPKVIIAGCGFLGEAAADLFSGIGWSVLGLCASADSAARLAGKSYPVRVTDISRPFTMDPHWHGADVLIHCASSGRGGPDAYRAVYLDGLLNAITAIQPRRTLFTGSTSVYAQADGSVVDESSETKPDRETGRILLDAEGVALASGGYVARLSGLYGPGRSVLLRKFLAGEAVIEGDGTRWINQIHRDDAARAIVHLFATRADPGVYNVSDNTPATQRDVYQWLADFFHRPLPPSGAPDPDRKRGLTSKRVSNQKIRLTGWQPVFGSFREAIPELAS